MIKSKSVQCQTESCQYYLNIFVIYPEPYTVPLHGHIHGPVTTYSVVQGKDGGYYGESIVTPMISTNFHTWPVIYCNGCGCQPTPIENHD